ncbi:InlB B-repeat-containing protein [Hominenteromicrobium sp.]|uniref:InlB B-repeat-containing protein n=1 Tax=Hominenteromicrobium sp. TaxID=3073581 RepID=UPI003AB4DFCA
MTTKDTTPPVIEGVVDGWDYTVDDNDDGTLGTIDFTVRDPAAEGETVSGIQSVTVNGEEQTVQSGQVYQLTAPDGGNGDEGLWHEIVVTDKAGNSTTAKVRVYRRHRVLILSDRNDPSSAILHLGVPHGYELKPPFDHLPKEAYFVDLDNENIKIYREENNEYNFGIINSNRKFLLVIPKTELPTLTVRVGNKSFWDYRADAPDEFCYVDPVDKYGEGYAVSLGISSDETSYYFETATRYTLKELKELDDKGSIKWYKYNSESWSLTLIGPSFEDYHGEWYVYAKATNEVGTKYVSSPKLILDCSDPAATVHPSGKELEGKANSSTAAVEGTTYWGNLQFKVHDETPVTVQDGQTVLKPDENGIYTIPADMDDNVYHNIYIRDSCGNTIFYLKNKVRWNTLAHVDTLDEQKLPHGAVLSESLPATVTVRTAASGNQSVSVPVKWDEAADYVPAAKREQHFTVTGTLDLSGTDIVVPPEQEALQTVTVEVTVAGAPQYRVTAASSENGTVTVVNATETAEDGTPLFCKDDLVMLSIAPNEGYMLSTLSINGTPASFAVEDDTYTFAQPEENVTITATFEKRNEHTITFDANGGSEPEDLPEEVTTAMPAKKVLRGSEYSLPECEFIAPEGKQFKAWEIDGTEYPVNAPVTVTADITVKALWEDAPPAPAEFTITVKTDGNGTASASPAKAVAGEEITLTATPKEDYRFKEWQVVSPAGLVITNNKFTMPDSNVEVKAIFEEDAPPVPTEFTITVTSGGNGTASASHAKAVAGTEIRLTATPKTGYHFKEWEVISGGVTIKDDKFLMPNDNVEVKAIFEKDAPPAPTDPAKPSISVTGTYTYNGSVHTATVNGYDPATMDITGNTATDAGDYTVRVTSKTGKWADGSTDAVTAAWSISKATQEAPSGLTGVEPSTEDGSDGKITGVTDKMEYRMEAEGSYTPCSGTEIENLSAGNYFVRYAEDNNHFASSDAAVTVGKGASLADCTITFNGNGGSGNMDSVTVKTGTNYILPECGFTAPTDQEFKAWEISGKEYKVGDTYIVSGDTEIKALWENSVITPTTYTVTVGNDGNGTGTATPSTAATGTEITLTAMPKEGYHFKEWQVISGGVTIKNNKFTMPNDNVEVKAVFEEDVPAPTEFTITMKTDGNGTASASHAKAIVGTEITLSATPKTGYHFKEWQVISGSVTIKDNKFIMPNDNVEVKAIFEKDAPPAPTEFTITFDGNGGTPSVDSMTTTNQKLTSLPSASRSGSYSFDGWYTEESGGTKITTDTEFPADTTVYAHWTYTGGGGSSGYSYYTIKATAGAGGSISPSGNVSVREGRDQTFTITPDKGYAVANVKIDGKSIGAVKSYTFENVSRTHTIEVIFMKANGNPQTGVFVDVATGSYYEDAVDWAVENGITQGTDDTHFSPDGICTRAQAVTFLWRAAGSPKPETRTMPFTDVPVGSYYYDAVLWAVENGITKGTSDTTFSPNMICTRAQIVTFLWRSEKSPAAGTANPFADVKSTAYYAGAVLWAVKENITKGTTSTTFSPNADCTRAQIVTFLWRCKK